MKFTTTLLFASLSVISLLNVSHLHLNLISPLFN